MRRIALAILLLVGLAGAARADDVSPPAPDAAVAHVTPPDAPHATPTDTLAPASPDQRPIDPPASHHAAANSRTVYIVVLVGLFAVALLGARKLGGRRR